MLILAVVAAGVIRLLMGVVAHEEAGGFVSATADYSRSQTYDPTMPAARPVNDDVRGFLLPAVEDPPHGGRARPVGRRELAPLGGFSPRLRSARSSADALVTHARSRSRSADRSA